MTKFLALSMALLLALAGAAPAAAQEATGSPDWAAVLNLSPGDKLEVATKNFVTVRGRFVSANEAELVLSENKQTVRLRRDEVKRVHRRRGPSRKGGAVLGALVGGGVGFGVGATLYLPYRDDIAPEVVPAFTLLGAGIGAGIGAALGKGQKDLFIYEAP